MLPIEPCKLKRAIFPPPEARRKHAPWLFFPLRGLCVNSNPALFFSGKLFSVELYNFLLSKIYIYIYYIHYIIYIYIYILYIYIVLLNRSTCWVAPPPGNKWRFCKGMPVLKEIPGGPTSPWDSSRKHPVNRKYANRIFDFWRNMLLVWVILKKCRQVD